MRLFVLILALGLFTQTIADPGPDPEPKKYKPETKEKVSKITAEEKAFLKEVEAKYGIKSDKPQEEKEQEKVEGKVEEKVEGSPQQFPGVIAIEIVNDTETDGKEKRTIDANLGYGYRTNNGYTYTYFGKPKQEQGKFMIYPYSQEDIPAAGHAHQSFGVIQRPQYHQQDSRQSHSKFSSQYSLKSPNVEIHPSQAYELVPVTEETPSTYHSRDHISELKTAYERVKSLETPPPPQYSVSEAPDYSHPRVPSTLYTTYNGGQLSGLTGQFPTVMSNYFVDSSQLLRNPQFQSVGLTSDHLRQHGPTIDQRVVPVLVLRVPSSHLRNPSADLYPNLPSNYPLSNYLNNVNLQDLVSQYFKKIGYPQVPQLMTHYTSPFAQHVQYVAPTAAPIVHYSAPPAPVPTPISPYGPPAAPVIHYQPQPPTIVPQYQTQHYAAPEPQPTYTHTDYSGVQYSAVQPVMAKYPSVGQRFTVQNPHTGEQTLYQYVQPTSANFRHYLQAEYQNPHYQQPRYEFQYVEGHQQSGVQYQPTRAEYETPKQPEVVQPKGHSSYGPPGHATEHSSSAHSSEAGETSQHYAQQQSGAEEAARAQHYAQQQTSADEGETARQYAQQQTNAEAAARAQHYALQQASAAEGEATRHYAQQQTNANAESESVHATHQPQTQSEEKHVSISENYPSKDHTHVTVIPHSSYKSPPKQQGGVQSISYITPSPQRAKHHPYKSMAPQSILGVERGVSYVNSHSIPSSVTYRTPSYSQEYSSEQEQTVNVSYQPAVGSQRPPSYPRNYHSHASYQKRMASPKQETKAPSAPEKKIDSTDMKPSS